MLGIKSKIEKYFTYRTLPDEGHMFDSQQSKAVFESFYEKGFKKFQKIYSFYTSSISSAEMAISLEVCAALYAFCHTLKPSKILDMGSGLSSYIFRTYQAETGNVVVFSIDDNQEWLIKTRQFLEQSSLSQEHIYNLNDYTSFENHSFDLIFHDLNFVEERINHVDSVIKMASDGAYIIFDDVHKIPYYKKLIKLFKQNGLPFCSAKKFTLDRFNRFSILAKK